MTSSGQSCPYGIPRPSGAQALEAPLTTSVVFLVVTVRPSDEAAATVRATLAGLENLIKSAGFRQPSAHLSCTVGIGAEVWPRVVGGAMPAELHPFKEFLGETHAARATAGDLLFHIRADRPDMAFEFERILMEQLAEAVEVVDETTGFRYFDARDLLGFVDGTANPVGPALREAILVGDEDPEFAGGAYVVTQRYVHDLTKWNALSTEEQEQVIGRRKLDDVELPDAVSGQKSHKTLNTIEVDGVEFDIVRDNMPFGSVAADEYGTYFIGYSRRLWVTEKMLERMFIGDPPGLHDRILDVSDATTGTTFFAPSAEFLAGLATPVKAEDADGSAGAVVSAGAAASDAPQADASKAEDSTASATAEEFDRTPSGPFGDAASLDRNDFGDGSLGIGSLREPARDDAG